MDYSSKISEKEAVGIGVSSYIMNPINKFKLEKMVRKVLDSTKMSKLEKP
jgi:YesN/AraC family two-component response regulator